MAILLVFSPFGAMFLLFGYAGYYGIVEKDYFFRNENRTEKTQEKFAVVSGYFFLMGAIVGLTCYAVFAISENVTFFFAMNSAWIFAYVAAWVANMGTARTKH